MATSEQAITAQTGAQQSEEPQTERKYGGEPSMARVKQLLCEMFGPSPAKWIQGLLDVRKGAMPKVNGNWRELETRCAAAEKELAELRGAPHSDGELKAAYQRGRSDLQNEIIFAERLSAIRSKYSDFDQAWRSVRPLVPRAVWADMADDPDGLESAYQLSKLPELCQELSLLEPEKARERFRHFVKDLVALTKGMR